MQFVELDGTPHILAEGSVRTVCYLEVPYGSAYTTDQPQEVCDECATKAGIEQLPAPKGKAKSGSKA